MRVVDVDIALVRSFVVTADELHFRRAAELLGITQQALSQRIRRLENTLGVMLFVREGRSVELSEHGRRFLAPAIRLLAAADAALEAVRPERQRLLRIDVVDGRLAPLRLVRKLVEDNPDVQLSLSMRQRLSAALPALVRGEIDAAFGRVHDVSGTWPASVTSRLMRLEPLHAVVLRDHPLADRSAVETSDLRKVGVWLPYYGTPSEWVCYVRRFADAFDVPLTLTGPVVDEEHLVRRMRERGDEVCLSGGDVSYDHSDAIRSIPVTAPVPLYPWSLVWRRYETHHLIEKLFGVAHETGADGFDYDSEEQWLPEPDRELLAR